MSNEMSRIYKNVFHKNALYHATDNNLHVAQKDKPELRGLMHSRPKGTVKLDYFNFDVCGARVLMFSYYLA